MNEWMNLVKNSLIKMLKPLSVSFNWRTTLSCTFSLVLWGNSSGLLNIKTFKLNCLIIYEKKGFRVLSTFPINISVVISQSFKSLKVRELFLAWMIHSYSTVKMRKNKKYSRSLCLEVVKIIYIDKRFEYLNYFAYLIFENFNEFF